MAHKPAGELFSALNEAKSKVKIGGTYYHYKHADQFYTLIDVVLIEATEEVGVLYRAEYKDLKGIIFMRPLDDFLATVDVDGKKIARFTQVK